MRQQMTAFCGLDCEACPAYVATVEDDAEKRRTTAEKWSTPEYTVTLDDVNCLGCKQEGPHFKWCDQCSVRACASAKNVETCAHCGEYVCDTLEDWLASAGEEARRTLERIRSGLQ